jgi:TetR/AcrR family transcriptional regulator
VQRGKRAVECERGGVPGEQANRSDEKRAGTKMTTETYEAGSPERRILDAALQTIAEDKISGTRMRRIAEKAGMSQGNLHYYFPAKAQLFFALLEDMLATFVEDRESDLLKGDLPPLKKLELFFDQMRRIILERRRHMYAFYDFWVQGTTDDDIRVVIQGMYARWREDIRQVVREGVNQGIFDASAAQTLPPLMVSLMEGAALQHLIDGEALDLDAYFSAAMRIISGLGTAPQE